MKNDLFTRVRKVRSVMPQRIARTTIHNASTYLQLVQTAGELCGGEWTEGMAPPETIAPGATLSIQSESGGDIPIIGNVMTGTQGWVKYDAVGPDRRHGMVYFYWTNPWWGFTRPRWATDGDDVAADCGGSATTAESSFAVDDSLDFSLHPILYRHTDGGGTITGPGDLAAAVAEGPVLGTISLFGFVGIVKDPEWQYELRDESPSTFAPSEPRTYSLMTKAEPHDWIGEWRKDEVTVSIIAGASNQLNATISLDRSSAPITASFTIGPESAFVGRLGDTENHVSASPDHLIITKSIHQLIAEQPNFYDHTGITQKFGKIAQSVHEKQKLAAPFEAQLFESIGREVGSILADSRATVHAAGFVFSLLAIYEGNSRVGKMLHVQRVIDGTPTVDVVLEEKVDIR